MAAVRSPLIVLALSAVGLLLVPSAPAQSQGRDSVTGTASQCVASFEPAPGQPVCNRELVIDVEATSDAAGASPSGIVSLRDVGLTPGGTTTTTANVTCLAVSGNGAIIGVAGKRTQGGFPPEPVSIPIAGLFRVVDGGGPGSGADTIEGALQTGPNNGPPLPGPTTCSTFPGQFPGPGSEFPAFVNASGDLVVVDAPPRPTTKDRCKHGGWKKYGIFRNQGRCVSYSVGSATLPLFGPIDIPVRVGA
jgi:hypothetical protein